MGDPRSSVGNNPVNKIDPSGLAAKKDEDGSVALPINLQTPLKGPETGPHSPTAINPIQELGSETSWVAKSTLTGSSHLRTENKCYRSLLKPFFWWNQLQDIEGALKYGRWELTTKKPGAAYYDDPYIYIPCTSKQNCREQDGVMRATYLGIDINASGKYSSWSELMGQGSAYLGKAINIVASGVEYAATKAFEKLLKSIGADALFEALKERLSEGVDLNQVAKVFINFAGKFLNNLASGVQKGFALFCGLEGDSFPATTESTSGEGSEDSGVQDNTICPKFFERMMGVLGDFFSDIGINIENLGELGNALVTLDFATVGKSLITLVANALDIGYEGAINIASKLVGSGNVNIVLGVFGKIFEAGEALTQDFGGWLYEEISGKIEAVKDHAQGLWDEIKNSWISLVPAIVAKGIISLAAKFVPGAGAISWLKTIYDLAIFVKKQWSRAEKLFEKISEVFKLVVNSIESNGANLIPTIGESVLQLLNTSLVIAFNGLLAAFGLGNVGEKLKEGITSIRDKIEVKLIALFKPLADGLLKAINTFKLSIPGFADKKLIGGTVALEEGHELFVVKEGTDAVPMMASAEPLTALEQLECWQGKCPEQLSLIKTAKEEDATLRTKGSEVEQLSVSASGGEEGKNEKVALAVKSFNDAEKALAKTMKALIRACGKIVRTRPDSKILGKNLEKKSGDDRDVDRSNVSNQPEAHHIVAGAAGEAEARDILTKPPVCIGINEAINGIFLPKTSGVNVPASTNLLNRVFHNYTQRDAYYVYILRRLSSVQRSRTQVQAVLREIRSELEANQVNW